MKSALVRNLLQGDSLHRKNSDIALVKGIHVECNLSLLFKFF